METLGERIVNARNKKGLSQEKFAEQLGVSRQMVSRWELNTAVPRMSRMEKICELLDLTANELINGKEGDEPGKNQSNNSQEPVAYKYKYLKFKAFIKRTALILLKLLLILLTLYIAYTTFKLIVLKHVINKVSQYENLDNYYCKIRSFDETETESVKEIWYKDGIYKIMDTTRINETDVKTTLIVDLNNKCRYQIDEMNKIARKRNLIQTEEYENGRFMYTNFPVEINKNMDYLSTSFKINKVFYYKKDNKYYLEVNNGITHLDGNTYLPVFNNIKTKSKNINNNMFSEYDIKLDTVQDEDVRIPSEYNIQ